MDTSGSIHRDEYIKEKHFVTNVVKHIGLSENGPHYGVILFGQFATVDIKFNDYYNITKLRNAVMSLPQSGATTRIDRGLRKAYKVLFQKKGGHRELAEKYLFLLTDGSQSKGSDVVDPHLIAKKLQFIGIHFYVVGIGTRVNVKELESIAGGKEKVFLAKNFDDLISNEFIEKFNITCGKGIIIIFVVVF